MMATPSPSSSSRHSTQHSPKDSRRTKIKWFSGVRMQKALRTAAKRGIEDMRKLLVVAGNDIESLDKSISVTRLVSKLRIS